MPLYEECVNATGTSKILIHCKAYETRFPGGAYIEDVRNRIKSATAASEPPAAEERGRRMNRRPRSRPS